MEINVLYFIVFAVVAVIFIIFGIISVNAFHYSDKVTDNAFIQENVPKLKDCGECGCVTCDKFVDKVRRKRISVYRCPYTTLENKKNVSKYFEKSDVVEEDKVAVVLCKGGKRCTDKYECAEIVNCLSLSKIDGGNKTCDKACLGCGDCAKICPVRAISINDNGVAVVDPLKCVGCEACTTICPKNLIRMIPRKQKVASICVTPNFSKDCSVGCSGCGLCVANCPVGAISINDGVVEINDDKCIGCLNCVRICPRHTISRI